jgi:Calcineurin-like phosphoesterase
MGRTVIVGDVHGCRAELETLLEHVRFSDVDRLILVGDVVVRGPDSRGTLALAKRLGARMVRGNHEHKLLAMRSGSARPSPEHERVASELTDEEWRLLEAMPLRLDLPEHGLRVVHAGVVPGMDIDHTPPEALLRIRTIKTAGHWSDERDGGPPWGSRYTGPPHVVYGHNALPEAQLFPWATGIDTGCVYGGRLTAVVLDAGEPMPRGDEAKPKLASVPARSKYASGGSSARVTARPRLRRGVVETRS